MKTSERYGTILYDAKIKLIDFICLGGRVRMRFRIFFWLSFASNRKISFKWFPIPQKKLFIVHIDNILQQQFFFSLHGRNLELIFSSFCGLIHGLFGQFSVIFFLNACSILELILWNFNLTKEDIPQASSNTTAPTLLMNENLKK